MSYDIGSHLTVNNYFGVLQGVIHDLGIGVLPDYLTQDFPDLVRVLPDVQSARCPSSSPIPRSCGNPSGSRSSAIS
jgi:DNA-binding transcriptional LysR family regulator